MSSRRAASSYQSGVPGVDPCLAKPKRKKGFPGNKLYKGGLELTDSPCYSGNNNKEDGPPHSFKKELR
jgi:hypothetical protein